MILYETMEKVLAKLIESAEIQYQVQLDALQKEHARHVAEIEAAFGLRPDSPNMQEKSV